MISVFHCNIVIQKQHGSALIPCAPRFCHCPLKFIDVYCRLGENSSFECSCYLNSLMRSSCKLLSLSFFFFLPQWKFELLVNNIVTFTQCKGFLFCLCFGYHAKPIQTGIFSVTHMLIKLCASKPHFSFFYRSCIADTALHFLM